MLHVSTVHNSQGQPHVLVSLHGDTLRHVAPNDENTGMQESNGGTMFLNAVFKCDAVVSGLLNTEEYN